MISELNFDQKKLAIKHQQILMFKMALIFSPAASIIVMAIVGGAVFPPLMGYISDIYTMSISFLVPIPLFGFIFYYALKGHHVKV